ncbi:MAG: methyltransferase domain-containing protein [Planctomycetes bacterium]|nr:methyltransferase domain-containing protein [Planctomycetota bacterium]
MKKPADIEREFNVPIPGKILDSARWTKTALKKLPAQGPLDIAGLFGRAAPLVVDMGCGNGRFLLGSALSRPDFDHIGIDVLPMVLRYATRRGNQRGLGNLRFAAVDAQRFLAVYLAPGSVREIHCYHPQPFHDARDRSKRLFTPAFLVNVHKALEPAGAFYIQTDNAPYWDYLKQALPVFVAFQEQRDPWPDAPRGRTRREIIAMRRGYAVYRGWGVRKEMTIEEAVERAKMLPPPDFDAGPRHKDLDELERG